MWSSTCIRQLFTLLATTKISPCYRLKTGYVSKIRCKSLKIFRRPSRMFMQSGKYEILKKYEFLKILCLKIIKPNTFILKTVKILECNLLWLFQIKKTKHQTVYTFIYKNTLLKGVRFKTFLFLLLVELRIKTRASRMLSRLLYQSYIPSPSSISNFK